MPFQTYKLKQHALGMEINANMYADTSQHVRSQTQASRSRGNQAVQKEPAMQYYISEDD